MIRVALVFPGQGSQAVGMGQALHREFPAARRVFAEASEAAGFDLASLCFEGPAEKLDLTEFTQPAVLTVSLAAFAALREEIGLDPAMAAGHSLGEYSALAASGAISLADAVRAVRARAQWMQQAVPAGEGAMAAVMKVPRPEIEQICREAAGDGQVSPANDNAPGQVVISGHARAVDRALELVKEKGGRSRKLKVSGPFHTSLMAPAAEKMDGLLRDLDFGDLAFPVFANVDAKPYPGADGVRERLVRQIVSPVRWQQTVENMAAGADLFIEAGPGSILAGLIGRCLPGARVLPCSEPGHLAAIREGLAS